MHPPAGGFHTATAVPSLPLARLGRAFGALTAFGLGGRLDLLAGSVFVVRVLLHVKDPQPLGLLDKGVTFRVVQHLPALTETFGDLRVVHVGLHLGDLPPLDLRPHHKRIHGTFDVVGI